MVLSALPSNRSAQVVRFLGQPDFPDDRRLVTDDEAIIPPSPPPQNPAALHPPIRLPTSVWDASFGS